MNLAGAKTQSNPENAVGYLSLGGKRTRVDGGVGLVAVLNSARGENRGGDKRERGGGSARGAETSTE